MLKKLCTVWVPFRKEPFLASLQYLLHDHVLFSYSELKGLCVCYMDKTICVPCNNAAVILELCIALYIFLEVGTFQLSAQPRLESNPPSKRKYQYR